MGLAEGLNGGGRPIELSSGRRLSTKDFIKQMQQLDPKSKIQQVEQSDAPENIKKEVKRVAKAENDMRRIESHQQRPRGSRVETLGARPRAGTAESSGTGSRRPDGPRTRSETMPSISQRRDEEQESATTQTRPGPERNLTTDTLETIGSEPEEDVIEDLPTHDVRSSLIRHGQGQTAADLRRRRLSGIRTSDAEDDAEDEAEGETAAEKRRRFAALGMGGDQGESSSESEDEEGPRRLGEQAVQEPGHEAERVQRPTAPPMRVQWGGERGRSEIQPRPTTEANEGGNSGGGSGSGGGVGKKVKSIFGRH